MDLSDKNNKGQILVTFLILLPVLILLFMVVIENANIYYKKHHAISVTKTIITKALLKNEKDDIINIYKDNDIEVNDLKVNYDDGVNISFTFKINSLINILNKDDYIVKINLTGYLENNKVKIKKG